MEKFYNVLTYIIIALLVGSLAAKLFGIILLEQIMWFAAIVCIVVWLILRAKGKKG